jgi:hypothetical protein
MWLRKLMFFFCAYSFKDFQLHNRKYCSKVIIFIWVEARVMIRRIPTVDNIFWCLGHDINS